MSEPPVVGPRYKRTFTLSDLHAALVLAPRAARVLRRNRKLGIVSQQAIERIMLAVTEVNVELPRFCGQLRATKS